MAVDSLPRFPKPKPQRDVAGRHYLTKSEINSLLARRDLIVRHYDDQIAQLGHDAVVWTVPSR